VTGEFGAPPRPVFSSSMAGPDQRSWSPDGRLDGTTAVVTGASGLLGAAMATELAGRGAAVLLIGRDRAALDDAARTARGGPPIAGLRCDLASAEDIDAAAEFVRAVGRPVDLLVHATGLSDPSTIGTSPVELLDEHYLLNLRGPYQLTQRLLPVLSEPRGRVVFFTSAGPAAPDDVHHTMTDAALRSMAEALRGELAPSGRRVLTVATDAGVGRPEESYLPSLARTIVDSVVEEGVDVTELLAAPVPRRARTEQR